MSRKKVKVRSPYGEFELEGDPDIINLIIKKLLQKPSSEKKIELKDVLATLVEEGFFNEPKTLTDTRKELMNRGFNYDSPTILPVLKKYFIKEGILRRKGKRRKFKYYFNIEKEF